MTSKQEHLTKEFIKRYQELPQSYFDEKLKKAKAREAEYEAIERAQCLSYEQMHREFDI